MKATRERVGRGAGEGEEKEGERQEKGGEIASTTCVAQTW